MARIWDRAALVPPHLVRRLRERGSPSRLPCVDRFPAALLFADVSGFTALTERLQARGRDGAAEIVQVINAAFAPAMAAVARQGGSIVTFGGDALFVVFEGARRVRRALAAAAAIGEQFASGPARDTSVGPVTLGISQVVHHGVVAGIHLGRPERRVYVVEGRPVSTLARMEARAAAGVLVVSTAARRQAKCEPARGPAARETRTGRVADLLPYVPLHARDLKLPFEGEFRRVVMMFLESRGAAPERLQSFVLLLQETLDRFDGILVSPDLCDGGLRWLCCFGMPAAHEDDPERGALAALELLARLPRGIELRGGLQSGVVAHIQVGDRRRASLELMGDVTNTAARIMAQASWGEVLVSGSLRDLAGGVEVEARGSRSMKGKAQPLELFALKTARRTPRRLAVALPVVGREPELARLAGALVAGAEGRGSALAVVGDPGVGKSRLKYEAGIRARALGFDVHEGRAVAFGAAPYGAAAQVVRSALGLAELAGPEETLARLGAAASRLSLDAMAHRHLADVLGVRDPLTRVAEVAPADRQRNDLRAIRELFLALARERPLLLVLEDMHWSDRTSIEVARELARAAPGARLVVLLIARPGYVPPEDVPVLALEELGPAHVRALLAAHLGTAPEEALVKLVWARAGGNPFYVEEVLRHLLETGLLVRAAGGHRIVRELTPGELPAGVESVIAARLDRLSAGARRVAQQAAVIGRSFLLELLERLPGAGIPVAQAVEELRGRELVFPLQRERPELIWKHALTRDVAYASILPPARRGIHRDVADAIEAVLADDLPRLQALLGHHREQAGDVGRARACYLAGARRAADQHALEEALALYRSFLRIDPAPSEENVRARLEMAHRGLATLGRTVEAEELFRASIGEARSLRAEALEGESLSGLADMLRLTAGRDEAIRTYEQAIPLLARSGSPAAHGKALLGLAIMHDDQGRPDESMRWMEQALQVARAAGDRGAEGKVLGNVAMVDYHRGQFDTALAGLARALAIAEDVGDLLQQGLWTGNMGVIHYEQGRIAEARERYQRALTVAREMSDRRMEGLWLANLGFLHEGIGELATAEKLDREALAIFREVGERHYEAIFLANLAENLSVRGRDDEARALYESALAIQQELGDRRAEGVTLVGLGDLAFGEGRLEEARELFERAIAIDREVQDTISEGQAMNRLAELEIEVGRIEEARALLEEAVRLEARAGMRTFEANGHAALARCHLLAGDLHASAASGARADELLGDVPGGMRVRVACVRGHLALASGRDPGPIHVEARRRWRELGEGQNPRVSRWVERLERAIGAARRGTTLVRGMRAEDLTEAQREWVLRRDAHAT